MTAALIEAMPKYNPSPITAARPTSPVRRAVRQAPLFALAAGVGFILLWGPTHASQSTPGRAPTEAGQVTTLSSQELLSHLRAEEGSGRSPVTGAPSPASVTVVATPPGPRH
jgi:hypothetical protein